MGRGKSIFISGGGSGIGRAVALRFAAEGWFVGIGDVDRAGMEATLALLPPGRGFAVPLDVRDRAQWDAALSGFAAAAGGGIAVVMNNAGVAYGGPLAIQPEAEIDHLIAVNFKGVVLGAQAAHPWLAASAPGSCLLNTASASAIYGTAGLAVYSATKFAVRALTEALDCEWQDEQIRVRSLMPSFIDTPLLAGPVSGGKRTKREMVVTAGLEFTPVEQVAEAAWQAVHGKRLHTLVGKTARKLRLAALVAPGIIRKRAKALMQART